MEKQTEHPPRPQAFSPRFLSQLRGRDRNKIRKKQTKPKKSRVKSFFESFISKYC